jgi:hypothetical protein
LPGCIALLRAEGLPLERLVIVARSGVLIIIHDPNRRVVGSAHFIAQFLHLPLGAAKVTEAMLGGTELKEYAEREGISVNTMKYHLKIAFDRSGARSQVDLVRMAILALSDLEAFLGDCG